MHLDLTNPGCIWSVGPKDSVPTRPGVARGHLASLAVVATLLGAACSGAGQSSTADPSAAPVVDGDAFIIECLAAKGWRIRARPGTEELGVEFNELGRNADFAEAEKDCRQNLAARVPSDPVDVPSEVAARAVEASRSAYLDCLRAAGFAPVEDETFETTGGSGGFSFAFPSADRNRVEFRATVGRCGEAATAAGDSTTQRLLDELGDR